MGPEIRENDTCCNSSSCGCHIDAYSTPRACPECGKKLRLTGRSQTAKFRLTCQSCGYAGPILSQEELYELI